MWLEVNGQRAYAYTGGRAFDAARPVIAFVHGAQHDHSVWILQSRYLAHHGFSVLAFDLPGHGRSEGGPLAGIEAMADWVLAALAAAGVERASIAGHSMGSLIALDVAARAPEVVDRAILIGSVFPMPVSDALLDAAREDEPRAFDMINRWSHWNTDNRPGCPGPGFSIWHQNLRLMQRQKPGVLLGDFTACNAYSAGFERADALACPVLFVLGQRDMMTPPRAARPLIQRCAAALTERGLPAPKVVEIPDCGHAIMTEQPEAVLVALRSFLAEPLAKAA
jgi:pimeloyl-ACP methyl ester carboxylesterase